MSSGAFSLGTGLLPQSTAGNGHDVHRDAPWLAGPPKLQRKSARAVLQQTGIAQSANSSVQPTGESQDVHWGAPLSAGPPKLQRKSLRATTQQTGVANFANSSVQLTSESQGAPLSAGPPKLQRKSARSSKQQRGVVQFSNNTVQLTGQTRGYETVADVMTTKVVSVSPEATVHEALDLIVKHRITGMPVVNGKGKVVGVVSDYDLLAMDLSNFFSQGMFPSLDQSWQAFRELQMLMTKVEGKTVEDVMTTDPVSVRPNTSLDMAARLLLESKIRRLPVLDKEGKLVGVISRRNIIVSALAERRMDMGAFDIVGQLS